MRLIEIALLCGFIVDPRVVKYMPYRITLSFIHLTSISFWKKCIIWKKMQSNICGMSYLFLISVQLYDWLNDVCFWMPKTISITYKYIISCRIRNSKLIVLNLVSSTIKTLKFYLINARLQNRKLFFISLVLSYYLTSHTFLLFYSLPLTHTQIIDCMVW